jgi:hypothetical protein
MDLRGLPEFVLAHLRVILVEWEKRSVIIFCGINFVEPVWPVRFDRCDPSIVRAGIAVQNLPYSQEAVDVSTGY